MFDSNEFIDIVHRIFNLPRLDNSPLDNENQKMDIKSTVSEILGLEEE